MTTTQKHTPGPWAKHQFRGRTEKIISADNNDWTVCSMPNWIGDHEEKEANAALIAAAPDLLEALKSLRDTLNRNGYATEHADAAIAKAEGR